MAQNNLPAGWPKNECQVSEEKGEWKHVTSWNFYEMDMVQWRLVVEEVVSGHWCAKVVLGVSSDINSPVRMSGPLPTLEKAKRWAVLALHEVANAMLDVEVPSVNRRF